MLRSGRLGVALCVASEILRAPQSPKGIIDIGVLVYITDMGDHGLLILPRP